MCPIGAVSHKDREEPRNSHNMNSTDTLGVLELMVMLQTWERRYASVLSPSGPL